MMTKTLGTLLILLPLVFIGIMWMEGGLLGVGLYMLYLFAVTVTVVSPVAGVRLLRSK